MSDYYDGVLAFRKFFHGVDLGYDWADLSDQERAKWAKIEREQKND